MSESTRYVRLGPRMRAEVTVELEGCGLFDLNPDERAILWRIVDLLDDLEVKPAEIKVEPEPNSQSLEGKRDA